MRELLNCMVTSNVSEAEPHPIQVVIDSTSSAEEKPFGHDSQPFVMLGNICRVAVRRAYGQTKSRHAVVYRRTNSYGYSPCRTI